MGFDVIGAKPANECGKYFRNNVWWWRPLWGFVIKECQDILTEQELRGGCFNDGVYISAKKARVLGLRLRFLIDQKKVEEFEKEYQKALDGLPDKPCEYCSGTGKRDDEQVKGQCNGCGGKGTRRPWACHYPFSEENIRDFSDFAIHSGGFRIC